MVKTRERPSKEELNRLYMEEMRSTTEIAEKYNVVHQTVTNWMDKFKIKRRNKSTSSRLMHGKTRPSREELNNLYYERKLSTRNIAKIFDVNSGTIASWMGDYNIRRRSKSESALLQHGKIKPSKNQLKELFRKGSNPKEIAKVYDITDVTIRRLADYYKIGRKKRPTHVKRGSWRSLDFALEQAKLFLEQNSQYFELPSYKVLLKEGFGGLARSIVEYHGRFDLFREKLNQYLGRTSSEEKGNSLLEQYVGSAQ